MKSSLLRGARLILVAGLLLYEMTLFYPNNHQTLAFIGIHSAGQSNPSAGGAEIRLSAETARVALAGDIVTIPLTKEKVQVEGAVLRQTEDRIGNRFLVVGNGCGAVVVGSNRYEVLALDWSGKQEAKRTVHQPWREAELSLKELAAAPQQFIGRLYLLSGEIAASSQNKPVLGRKESNARLFDSYQGPVWVTNCPPGNKERRNQATLLVEVRAAASGWSLFCHRTVPVLGWKEPEFKRERVVGDKITLPNEKADKVSILTGDLILVELRHTRSSKERYDREEDCLKKVVDLTDERSAGSYELILLRGVKPGEGKVRIFYRWWQDPVEQVVAYKVTVAP